MWWMHRKTPVRMGIQQSNYNCNKCNDGGETLQKTEFGRKGDRATQAYP
jgi:hypothetical protein